MANAARELECAGMEFHVELLDILNGSMSCRQNICLCLVLPIGPENQRTARMVFGWQSSEGTLAVQVGASAGVWLGGLSAL